MKYRSSSSLQANLSVAFPEFYQSEVDGRCTSGQLHHPGITVSSMGSVAYGNVRSSIGKGYTYNDFKKEAVIQPPNLGKTVHWSSLDVTCIDVNSVIRAFSKQMKNVSLVVLDNQADLVAEQKKYEHFTPSLLLTNLVCDNLLYEKQNGGVLPSLDEFISKDFEAFDREIQKEEIIQHVREHISSRLIRIFATIGYNAQAQNHVTLKITDGERFKQSISYGLYKRILIDPFVWGNVSKRLVHELLVFCSHSKFEGNWGKLIKKSNNLYLEIKEPDYQEAEVVDKAERLDASFLFED